MAIETTTSVDVKSLTPFKKFIMTLGVLPTSYLESMTYAELLMWFCNYLQETVIPTVNNNAEAVEELQNIINNIDLQDEVNNKLDEMAEDGTLENIINQQIFGEITSKYTIMLGDSYAKGATNQEGVYITSWCDYLKDLMNLSSNDYKKISSAGAGFIRRGSTSNTNFIEALQAEINNIPDLSLVKNIIVCGGYNDSSYSASDIKDAITTFNNYVTSNFPNAHLYIGCVGYDSGTASANITNNKNIATNVYPAYANATNSRIRYQSYTYLNGVENVLKSNYKGLMYTNNAHPNETGQKELAYAIYESMYHGRFDPYTYYNATLTPYNEVGTLNSGTYRVYHAGGNITVGATNIKISYAEADNKTLGGTDFTNILNYECNNFYVFSTQVSLNICESTAIVEDYTAGKFVLPCQIYMNNGVMQMRIIASSGTQTYFQHVKSILINNINFSQPAVLY